MEETRAIRRSVIAAMIVTGLAAGGLLAPLASAQPDPGELCTPPGTPTVCFELIPTVLITPVETVADPGPETVTIGYTGLVKFCLEQSSSTDGSCPDDAPAATLPSAGTSNPPCWGAGSGPVVVDCEDNDLVGDDEQAMAAPDDGSDPDACLVLADLRIDVDDDGTTDYGPFPVATVTTPPCP